MQEAKQKVCAIWGSARLLFVHFSDSLSQVQVSNPACVYHYFITKNQYTANVLRLLKSVARYCTEYHICTRPTILLYGQCRTQKIFMGVSWSAKSVEMVARRRR